MWFAAHIIFSDVDFEVTLSGTEPELEMLVLIEGEPDTIHRRAELHARALEGTELWDLKGNRVAAEHARVRHVIRCRNYKGEYVERLEDGVIAPQLFFAVVTDPEAVSKGDIDGAIFVEG